MYLTRHVAHKKLVPRKCRQNSLQFAVARRSPYAVVRLGSSVPNQIQCDHELPLHASTTIQRMSKAEIISGETISSTGRHERHRGLYSINTPNSYARYMIQASGRNSNFALAALSLLLWQPLIVPSYRLPRIDGLSCRPVSPRATFLLPSFLGIA